MAVSNLGSSPRKVEKGQVKKELKFGGKERPCVNRDFLLLATMNLPILRVQ